MNVNSFSIATFALALGLLACTNETSAGDDTAAYGMDTEHAVQSKPHNGNEGATSMNNPPQNTADQSAHDYSFVAINGEPMPLSGFEGQTVLVVNTASLCGFTKQYSGLQALYEKYEDDGFVVLGVPSNDFGGQEPGSNSEIKGFCEANFNVRFPLTEKTIVSGNKAHPFYQWARETLGEQNAPKWNFHKYLIGANGKLITAFSSGTNPASNEIAMAVEEAIKTAKAS